MDISTVALPQGFQTAGMNCGIKSDTSINDLALFVSEQPAVAAGVFTQNPVCGAPVQVSRTRVGSATARAIVINSGNANACTGAQGDDDAIRMTADVATELGCAVEDVLVCSTGVIGHFLPIDKISAAIPQLVRQRETSPSAIAAAARGMMTTDTFPKLAMREAIISGQHVCVCGAAKGAAMIAPNMATMLAVVMTDALLTVDEANAMLRTAVDRSFNAISVDGHTSTSDSVILLANGAANIEPLNADTRDSVQTMLNAVYLQLAQAIIRDAEGASHFVSIEVTGLPTSADASQIAKTVAESMLVKTAIAGNDPNWGRIVSAAGYSGVVFQQADVSLTLNSMRIFEKGVPLQYDEQKLSRSMKDNYDITIRLDFSLGNSSAQFWTSDLTTEYVRLNSEYTT